MRTIVCARKSSPHPEGMATPRLSSRALLNSHIACRDLTNGATPSIVTLGLDPRAHGRAWRLTSAIDPCTCFGARSEEHTSELQSLLRISYAVFCLKKKK